MTKEEIANFKILLEEFRKQSESGINEVTEMWTRSTLDACHPFFTTLIVSYKVDRIERLTVNKRVMKKNKRIRDIEYLKYPKPELVLKYGRCNLRSQSVFYGSTVILTSLNEMNPLKGDLITKSVWKLKEEKVLKICPIFHVQPKNGTVNLNSLNLEKNFYELLNKNFPENTRDIVVELTKFIAFQFSKVVNQDRDYVFSAYFANKILNEFEGGTIDGIIYPSVKSNLNFENIALKPNVLDTYYDLEKVEESIVTRVPSDGCNGYVMSLINNSKKIDLVNNIIMWEESERQPISKIDFFKKEFGIELD